MPCTKVICRPLLFDKAPTLPPRHLPGSLIDLKHVIVPPLLNLPPWTLQGKVKPLWMAPLNKIGARNAQEILPWHLAGLHLLSDPFRQCTLFLACERTAVTTPKSASPLSLDGLATERNLFLLSEQSTLLRTIPLLDIKSRRLTLNNVTPQTVFPLPKPYLNLT